MSKLNVYKHDGCNYYLVDDLVEDYLEFFKGTGRSLRKVIITRKIPAEDYLIARVNNGEITSVVGPNDKASARYDKVLIKKKYFDGLKLKPTVKVYEPELIELTDEEKFKDENSNPIEVQVRGRRHHDECFFNVLDISKGFGLGN